MRARYQSGGVLGDNSSTKIGKRREKSGGSAGFQANDRKWTDIRNQHLESIELL
jgi:hypothetical protein